jgi:hypothetical protein
VQKEKKRSKFVKRAASWVRGLRRQTKKSKEVQIVKTQRTSAPAPKWVQDAVTISDLHLSASQKKLVARLAHETREIVATTSNDAFDQRVKQVAWGGQADTPWWSSPMDKKDLDGAQILTAYLKIMEWPEVRHVSSNRLHYSSYVLYRLLLYLFVVSHRFVRSFFSQIRLNIGFTSKVSI